MEEACPVPIGGPTHSSKTCILLVAMLGTGPKIALICTQTTENLDAGVPSLTRKTCKADHSHQEEWNRSGGAHGLRVCLDPNVELCATKP